MKSIFCTMGIMRFLCDHMLAELGKWLRAAGYDTIIIKDSRPDSAIIDQAHREKRILLSRDHDMANDGIHLHSNDLESCVQELKEHVPINWLHAPFSRCLQCNEILIPEGKEWCCPSCQKLFWLGSHTEAMRKSLKRWAK